MAEPLTIYESVDMMEAELVRSLLEANNIESQLIGAQTKSYRTLMGAPEGGPVQVVIDSEDADKVGELFEAYLEDFSGFPIDAWNPKEGQASSDD